MVTVPKNDVIVANKCGVFPSEGSVPLSTTSFVLLHGGVTFVSKKVQNGPVRHPKSRAAFRNVQSYFGIDSFHTSFMKFHVRTVCNECGVLLGECNIVCHTLQSTCGNSVQ